MSAETNGWNVLSILEWGADYFEKHSVPSPRLSIEWLLADILDLKRLDLYLAYDRPLSPDELDKLRPLVKRRARHEPLQYITGHSDFLNNRFIVSPDVLIPRMETEQLTELILDDHASGRQLSILDIGTGSGCIAISLKNERAAWKVHAIDSSKKALAVAAENAKHQHADIHFKAVDISQNSGRLLPDHSLNLIVSNPPYILPDERNDLEKQVKNYEPSEALFCNSIEDIYQKIIDHSDNLLKKSGQLYLEINAAYSETILTFFDDRTWTCDLLEDYNGQPRFIKARRCE